MPPELWDTTESAESMGISALMEKMDALSAQVVQLASLMELQRQMPTQSLEKEKEEEVRSFCHPERRMDPMRKSAYQNLHHPKPLMEL
jgi:hypothetical protein